jgi:hypothetical protein
MSSVELRKAALALAAMHPADRRWMLAKLPSTSRSALDPLIAEARRYTTLDSDTLQAVLSDQPAYLVNEIPPPDVLIVVLDRLSAAWAARILHAVAQDHAEIYLAACARLRADAVRQEMGRLPEKFPRAMAESLGDYLTEAAQAARVGDAR